MKRGNHSQTDIIAKCKKQNKALIIFLAVTLMLGTMFTAFIFTAELARHQSWQSFAIECGARIALAGKRNKSAEECASIIEKAREKNKDYTVPRYYVKRYNIEITDFEGIEICEFNKNAENDNFIYYIHGGAYVDQPLLFHYSFLDELTTQLNCKAIMPIYPKAPNFTYLTVIDKVYSLYLKLLESVPASKITLMGDSAGGALALALCEYLKIQCVEQPANLIMFSPCTDATLTITDNEFAKMDPMFSENVIKAKLKAYAGGEEELSNYLVSPFYGDFVNIAPMTVFVGTYETLLPYVRQFHDKASLLGINMNYFEYDKMMHVFPLMPIPEAVEARERIVDIILN